MPAGLNGASIAPLLSLLARAYRPKMADSSLRARLHFMVGAGYAEIVGLAAGWAITALGIPLRTPLAEGAWRTSWRLAAGLPPAQLSFLCLND